MSRSKMDGIHDLGGKHGHGAVEREVNEPAFHSRWEAAVFAMAGIGRRTGAWTNADRFRHAIERIDPVSYLTDTYYGRWLGGIEALLVETGILTSVEVTAKAVELGADSAARVAARPASSSDLIPYPPDSGTARRAQVAHPRYAVGDEVRTVENVTPGHTRLPAYARGKRGTVIARHGSWVYPDSNAHGLGESPTQLYTVAFDGTVLWGEGAEPDVVVSLDLFEPYLLGSRWNGP